MAIERGTNWELIPPAISLLFQFSLPLLILVVERQFLGKKVTRGISWIECSVLFFSVFLSPQTLVVHCSQEPLKYHFPSNKMILFSCASSWGKCTHKATQHNRHGWGFNLILISLLSLDESERERERTLNSSSRIAIGKLASLSVHKKESDYHQFPSLEYSLPFKLQNKYCFNCWERR